METVRVEHPRPEVAVLTLDRPDKLNALSWQLVDDLHDLFDGFEYDNTTKVVVITGSGRGFCAGLDLTDTTGCPQAKGLTGAAAGMRTQERIAELVLKMRRIPQPVIAAVNGPAYGGGFALALAADIRVASPAARFCTQFIKLGLGGCDIGVSYTLPHLVGASKAFDLMLTAREVGADEADRIGLLARLVDADQLVPEALSIADTLCSYRRFSLVITKQVMTANLDASSFESAITLENRNQILASSGGEMGEAAKAFVERRAPQWKD